jgi:hypothetical protein
MRQPDTGDMAGGAPLSPDLVLVLPAEERRRAIAELAALGLPTHYAVTPPAAPPATQPQRLATSIVSYAIYRSVAALVWYVAIAIAIGLVVAALAGR